MQITVTAESCPTGFILISAIVDPFLRHQKGLEMHMLCLFCTLSVQSCLLQYGKYCSWSLFAIAIGTSSILWLFQKYIGPLLRNVLLIWSLILAGSLCCICTTSLLETEHLIKFLLKYFKYLNIWVIILSKFTFLQ